MSDTQLQNDAKKDLSDEIAAVKSAAKTELDTAASAANKLLSIAVGDESVLLTDAEAAAIPYVLHFVPAPFQGLVGSFAQAALASATSAINASVETSTKNAIAVAEATIATTVKTLEAHLS